MNLIAVGLNHLSAPVEVRELYAFPVSAMSDHLRALTAAPPLKEAVIISTCNRVEVYASARSVHEGFERIHTFLRDFHPNRPYEKKYFYSYVSKGAVDHLFEVASGLNSMVIGETEITGQVKAAYHIAKHTGCTGPHLNRLFQKSFQVAKMIRAGSKIGEGCISVASVAADLAVQIFGDLHDKRVLLLGSGNMSATTARALSTRGCKTIIVSNRMHDRAVHLAGELNGQAAHFDEWPKKFLEVDIMISSTAAPHPIVEREILKSLMNERKQRPVFLIDIAVPRDIERSAGELENVYLYDIDDLKVIADQNLALRQQELTACRNQIASAVDTFMAWSQIAAHRPQVPSEIEILRKRLTPLSP